MKADNVVTDNNRIIRISGLPGTDDTMTTIDIHLSYSMDSNVSMIQSARTLDKIVIPMIMQAINGS